MWSKCGWKIREKEIYVVLPSLVTPSSPSSPFCRKGKTTMSHLGVDSAKLKPEQTTTNQLQFWFMCSKPLIQTKPLTTAPIGFCHTTRRNLPVISQPKQPDIIMQHSLIHLCKMSMNSCNALSLILDQKHNITRVFLPFRHLKRFTVG